MVATAMPDQRLDLPVSTGLDLTDEQHVVSRRMQRVMPALEPGDTAFDHRRIRVAESESNAGETIGVWPRKPVRQLDLVVRQDVDRIPLGRFEGCKAA